VSGSYIQILQGDDYTFSTNVAVDGVIQNIAGSSLYFLAQADQFNDGFETTIINATSANGQITIANNVVTLTLNANVTANYPEANVFHWALKLQTAANLKYTIDRGRGCLLPAPVPI
jgi:hypothetical protein